MTSYPRPWLIITMLALVGSLLSAGAPQTQPGRALGLWFQVAAVLAAFGLLGLLLRPPNIVRDITLALVGFVIGIRAITFLLQGIITGFFLWTGYVAIIWYVSTFDPGRKAT